MTAIGDVLEQFKGKSADEIAAMAKKRGIKGRTGTTYGCPLAIMLDNTSTGTYIIGRRYIVRRSGRSIEKARTPPNVSTFIRKFDIGKYPELMAPAKRCTTPRDTRPRSSGPKNRENEKPRVIKNHISKLVDRFAQQV